MRPIAIVPSDRRDTRAAWLLLGLGVVGLEGFTGQAALGIVAAACILQWYWLDRARFGRVTSGGELLVAYCWLPLALPPAANQPIPAQPRDAGCCGGSLAQGLLLLSLGAASPDGVDAEPAVDVGNDARQVPVGAAGSERR